MISKAIARAILSFVAICAAMAQAQIASLSPVEVSLDTTPKRFIKGELQMWSSPFRRSSYSSRAATKYVLPFAIISASLIASDRKTVGALPNTPDQTRWSGRVSQAGAWYSVAGIAGSTYLAGKFAGDDHARETGLLALEALGHTQVAVFAIKQVANRGRPVDNDGHGGFWRGGTSFPSGHAASAFAVATVFAYEYRDHLAVPITAYSAATLVAASRTGARRHWLSDIFVGSSLGFMIGRATYRRNHNVNLPGVRVTRAGRILPEVGFGRWGPALSWFF